MAETLPMVERIPLSFHQEFLRIMDHGGDSSPFGPRYTAPGGWRILGEIDLAALQGALDDVVARHEALRTRVVLDDGDPYQQVLPPGSPNLLVTDLAAPADGDRDTAAEVFHNEVEAEVTVSVDEMPLLRAVLGRFDRRDAVFVLVGHHSVVDGWSAQLIMRDLAEYYDARRQGRPAKLLPTRQYGEYAAWQRSHADGPAVTKARAFWRENLRGARIVPVPTDRPRDPDAPFVTGWYRFLIEDEVRTASLALAKQTRTSSFMVLLAAHLTHLREQTGLTDLTVLTFTPGREPAWVQNTVGSFHNLLPLRTDITGCATFPEVLARVRATCLAAYAHDIPFIQILGEAPDLMSSVVADPDAAAVAFQLIQSPFIMDGKQIGDLRYVAMRRRLLSQAAGTQVPDGILWALEPHPAGGIVGKAGYTTNLFDESTVVKMVADYRQVLRGTVTKAA
jgi:hypothetical protein